MSGIVAIVDGELDIDGADILEFGRCAVRDFISFTGPGPAEEDYVADMLSCLPLLTTQIGWVDGDFEKSEADGTKDALAVIVSAARRFTEQINRIPSR